MAERPEEVRAAAPFVAEEARSLLSAVDQVHGAEPSADSARSLRRRVAAAAVGGAAVLAVVALSMRDSSVAPVTTEGRAAGVQLTGGDAHGDDDLGTVPAEETVPLGFEVHNQYTELTKRPIGMVRLRAASARFSSPRTLERDERSAERGERGWGERRARSQMA